MFPTYNWGLSPTLNPSILNDFDWSESSLNTLNSYSILSKGSRTIDLFYSQENKKRRRLMIIIDLKKLKKFILIISYTIDLKSSIIWLNISTFSEEFLEW